MRAKATTDEDRLMLTADAIYESIVAHRRREGFNPTLRQLAETHNASTREVRRCINELIAAGRLHALPPHAPASETLERSA
jgi:C4-dicarboxylate-specific signal transduction histidine kinase